MVDIFSNINKIKTGGTTGFKEVLQQETSKVTTPTSTKSSSTSTSTSTKTTTTSSKTSSNDPLQIFQNVQQIAQTQGPTGIIDYGTSTAKQIEQPTITNLSKPPDITSSASNIIDTITQLPGTPQPIKQPTSTDPFVTKVITSYSTPSTISSKTTGITSSGFGIWYPFSPKPAVHEGGTIYTVGGYDKYLLNRLNELGTQKTSYQLEAEKLRKLGNTFLLETRKEESYDKSYIYGVTPFYPMFSKTSTPTKTQEMFISSISKLYANIEKLGLPTGGFTKILSKSEKDVYYGNIGKYLIGTASKYEQIIPEIDKVISDITSTRTSMKDWYPDTKIVGFDPSKYHVSTSGIEFDWSKLQFRSRTGKVISGATEGYTKTGSTLFAYDFPFVGAEKYYSYKNMLEKDVGRTTALGWGWGGYGNVDIAYYKLMGEPNKAIERQVSQLARYDIARQKLASGDIGGFSVDYWSGYLSSPATQIGLLYFGGEFIGAGSKVFGSTVFAASHPTASSILGGMGKLAGSALISYGVYDIARTADTGDIGQALGKTWLLSSSLAAGAAGYEKGLQYKPTWSIGSKQGESFILQQASTSFRGRPILRYGAGIEFTETSFPSKITSIPKGYSWQTVKSFMSTGGTGGYVSPNIFSSETGLNFLKPNISTINIPKNNFLSKLSSGSKSIVPQLSSKIGSFDKWTTPNIKNLTNIGSGTSFTLQSLKGTYVFSFTPETVGITLVSPLNKIGSIGEIIGDVSVSSGYGITTGKTDFTNKIIERIGDYNPKIINLSNISGRSNFVETYSRFWQREYIDVEGMGRINLGIKIDTKQDILGIVESKNIPSSIEDFTNTQYFGSFRMLPKTPLLPSDVTKPWYSDVNRVLYETGFAKSFSVSKIVGGSVGKPGRFGFETIELPEFGISKSISIIGDKFLFEDTGLIWKQKPVGLSLLQTSPMGGGISDYEYKMFLEQDKKSLEQQISGMLSGLSLSQYEAKGITNLLRVGVKQDMNLLQNLPSMTKPRGLKLVDETEYISKHWTGSKPSVITNKQLSNINQGISNITKSITGSISIGGLKTDTFLISTPKIGMINLSKLGLGTINLPKIDVGTINLSKLGIDTSNLLRTDIITKTDILTRTNIITDTMQQTSLKLDTVLINELGRIHDFGYFNVPPPPTFNFYGYIPPGLGGGGGTHSYPEGWWGKKYKFRKFKVVDLFKDIKIGGM